MRQKLRDSGCEQDFYTFTLSVASSLQKLSSIRSLVQGAALALRLDHDFAFMLELVVSEAAINAMKHGNEFDPSKKISLSISSDGNSVEVTVEDQGKGFELKETPDPTTPENLLKPSNRGLLIIRSFMDEIEVVASNEGRNLVRMVKKMPTEEPN